MIERQRFSAWAQLALLLVLAGIGLIFGSFISAFIQQAWPHVQSARHAGGKGADINDVGLLRVMQITVTIFLFVIPALLFSYITDGKQPAGRLGFTTIINGKQMFFVVMMFMASFFITNALEIINQHIPITKSMETTFTGWENEYKKEAKTLGTMRSNGEYIMVLLILALLPAIAEEMLFRGCLQKVMINITRNVAAGIIITSILFSAMHGSYYGFLVRLFLGCMLGYIYYYGKNIWLNIAAHFLNNAFYVTAMYSISRGGGAVTDTDAAKNISEPSILYLGIAAAAALFYLFKMFKQESEFVISMHRLDEGLFKNDDTNNLL